MLAMQHETYLSASIIVVIPSQITTHAPAETVMDAIHRAVKSIVLLLMLALVDVLAIVRAT